MVCLCMMTTREVSNIQIHWRESNRISVNKIDRQPNIGNNIEAC